jgi:hypothetical protein
MLLYDGIIGCLLSLEPSGVCAPQLSPNGAVPIERIHVDSAGDVYDAIVVTSLYINFALAYHFRRTVLHHLLTVFLRVRGAMRFPFVNFERQAFSRRLSR